MQFVACNRKQLAVSAQGANSLAMSYHGVAKKSGKRPYSVPRAMFISALILLLADG
jgi:hypothetical protein